MVNKNKLIQRLKSKPKDFKWQEANTLLRNLGFVEIQGGGSRVEFYNKEIDCLLHFHKPHPSNELKQYVVKELLEALTKRELI